MAKINAVVLCSSNKETLTNDISKWVKTEFKIAISHKVSFATNPHLLVRLIKLTEEDMPMVRSIAERIFAFCSEHTGIRHVHFVFNRGGEKKIDLASFTTEAAVNKLLSMFAAFTKHRSAMRNRVMPAHMQKGKGKGKGKKKVEETGSDDMDEIEEIDISMPEITRPIVLSPTPFVTSALPIDDLSDMSDESEKEDEPPHVSDSEPEAEDAAPVEPVHREPVVEEEQPGMRIDNPVQPQGTDGPVLAPAPTIPEVPVLPLHQQDPPAPEVAAPAHTPTQCARCVTCTVELTQPTFEGSPGVCFKCQGRNCDECLMEISADFNSYGTYLCQPCERNMTCVECGGGESTATNPIMHCDEPRCYNGTHLKCSKLPKKPRGAFKCSEHAVCTVCNNSDTPEKPITDNRMLFCNTKGCKISMHVTCAKGALALALKGGLPSDWRCGAHRPCGNCCMQGGTSKTYACNRCNERFHAKMCRNPLVPGLHVIKEAGTKNKWVCTHCTGEINTPAIKPDERGVLKRVRVKTEQDLTSDDDCDNDILPPRAKRANTVFVDLDASAATASTSAAMNQEEEDEEYSEEEEEEYSEEEMACGFAGDEEMSPAPAPAPAPSPPPSPAPAPSDAGLVGVEMQEPVSDNLEQLFQFDLSALGFGESGATMGSETQIVGNTEVPAAPAEVFLQAQDQMLLPSTMYPMPVELPKPTLALLQADHDAPPAISINAGSIGHDHSHEHPELYTKTCDPRQLFCYSCGITKSQDWHDLSSAVPGWLIKKRVFCDWCHRAIGNGLSGPLPASQPDKPFAYGKTPAAFDEIDAVHKRMDNSHQIRQARFTLSTSEYRQKTNRLTIGKAALNKWMTTAPTTRTTRFPHVQWSIYHE